MFDKRLIINKLHETILIALCLTLIYLYWLFNCTSLNNTENVDLPVYVLCKFFQTAVPVALFIGSILFCYIFRAFKSAGKLSWLLVGILNFISCIILCVETNKSDLYLADENLALIGIIKLKKKKLKEQL